MFAVMIIAFVALFIVFGSIYGYRGWKHGWKEGLRSIGFVLVLGGLAALLAHFIAQGAAFGFINSRGNNEILQFIDSLGFYTPSLETITHDSIYNIQFTISSMVLFYIFLFIEVITTAIIRAVRNKKSKTPIIQPIPYQTVPTNPYYPTPQPQYQQQPQPQLRPQPQFQTQPQQQPQPQQSFPTNPYQPYIQQPQSTPKQKAPRSPQGLAIGFGAALLVCVSAFFMARFNLFTEAQNVERLLQWTIQLSFSQFDSEVLIEESDELVSLFFDSQIIAGSEQDKLELATQIVKNFGELTQEPLVMNITENINYQSKEQVQNDIKNIISIMNIMGGDISDNISNKILDRLDDYIDSKEGLSELIDAIENYEFTDEELKSALEDIIRNATQDADFTIEGDFDYSQYQDALLEVLEGLPEADEITDDVLTDIQNKLDELENSPLIPDGIFDNIFNK